jgi:formylglycine-generating enzyme required for sulfatase activity
VDLLWNGSDPDGDNLIFDVYLEVENSKPNTLVSLNQVDASFNPGTLLPNTHYYWKVISHDVHGATTLGPVWDFTTGTGGITPGEMILIPAGSFQMGCDPAHNNGDYCFSADELPMHSVNLDAYRIDKFEVTNAMYAQCVSAGACAAPAYTSSYTRSYYYGNPTYANYPVLYVSWYDAANYCSWVGKRLPTEAEWEKAARSSDTRTFPWGDASPTCLLVNGYVNGDCVGETSAVGSYPAGASPYGVMDLTGNVWEWVNDWWSDTYYSISPPSNPPGPASGLFKVVRRSGWGYYGYDNLRSVALRGYLADPAGRGSDVGFRCGAYLVP